MISTSEEAALKNKLKHDQILRGEWFMVTKRGEE
jgi:hypothetical protein